MEWLEPNDRYYVEKLKSGIGREWNLDGRCKIHIWSKRCAYKKDGQNTYLIKLHLCGLEVAEYSLKEVAERFDHLQELYLNNTQLNTLPPVGRVKTLSKLDLGNNPLPAPPQEIEKQGTQVILQYIQDLYNQNYTLNKNMVNQLQRILWDWKPDGPCAIHNYQCCVYDEWGQLVELHLCQLELKRVPPEIGTFSRLSTLFLNKNQLSTLPAEIGNLSALQKLFLDENQLSTLPAEIGNLSRLGSLSLNKNQLSTLPTVVCNLSNLDWLSLNKNQLSTLPAEIGNLSNLSSLFLDENQLSILPAEIGNLSRLSSLSLNKNQLSTLPTVVCNLSNLTWLYLNKNQLSTLPAEVGNLSKLCELFLDENQLSTLPAEIGNLSRLGSLSLDNNPLQTPPPEIVKQGIPAILGYLRAFRYRNALSEQPAVPQSSRNNMSASSSASSLVTDVQLDPVVERYEAKVILVGEGGMGKTSLLRALSQQPFLQDAPPTHGIEVRTLHVSHPTQPQQEITLFTWDFGGQEIYQATHQFFLTQRSVYLLVWNARLGVEACRLPFWLDTIKGHAPDAKILLVATHSDLWQTPTINLTSLRQRYPQIVGFCTISNKTGNGLSDLKAQIAQVAAQTPFVGQKWPRTWVNAEQQLLARPEHHIDISAFLALCIQQQIDDETERETFGRYLHDLGKILYFSDDPVLKSLVVLKPNWISKAISRVLVDHHVQQTSGVLEHRELARIWETDDQGQAYPHVLYPIFVRMMERFELCYQLEPERPGQPTSQSLIPQLLPDQPPASLPPVPTVPDAGQVLVEMRYTLSFVPKGLMSWFLVRTHRYSLRQHWREGARLTYVGQQAQIELDTQQREISINVWGPFPYTFLLILKQTLDDLLQSFQGLRVQRKIPCRCSQQQQFPHYHVYEDLERQLKRGHHEIVCSEGIQVSLGTLLYGIHASTVPQMVATMQQTQWLVTQSHVSADELRRLFVQHDQGLEFLYRTMLNLERQKLSNICPSLFVLERASRSLIHPHDWVSRGYQLRLLCQYPQGPHPMKGEQGYEVRQGEEWWNAMSPWLRRLVKVLEVGLPLGKAVNEGFKLVDIDRFAPEIDVFNEVIGDLPEIEVIDALSNAQVDAKVQAMQQLEGAALEAFHTFLKAHPRPWQGLSQIIAGDGTIWWVCEQHRKEFEAGLIPVV